MKKGLARLFLALPRSEEVTRIGKEFFTLNNHLPYRFVPLENLHITTVFLGDFPKENIPQLTSELKEFYANQNSLSLVFERIAWSPNQHAPRMIWMYFGMDPAFDSHVLSTQKLLTDIYTRYGLVFKPERRKVFVPHITLCRFKPLKTTLPELKMPGTGPFRLQAGQVNLFSSELLPGGARYIALKKFSLKQP